MTEVCPRRTESFHPMCCNRYMVEVEHVEGEEHAWTKEFACSVTDPVALSVSGVRPDDEGTDR